MQFHLHESDCYSQNVVLTPPTIYLPVGLSKIRTASIWPTLDVSFPSVDTIGLPYHFGGVLIILPWDIYSIFKHNLRYTNSWVFVLYGSLVFVTGFHRTFLYLDFSLFSLSTSICGQYLLVCFMELHTWLYEDLSKSWHLPFLQFIIIMYYC